MYITQLINLVMLTLYYIGKQVTLRYRLVIVLILIELPMAFARINPRTVEADSVYLFSYATTKNNNHNGLHFAWSRDRETWFTIGNEYSYLYSDYGQWGAEKRMISPYVFNDINGVWHCVWSLNEKENVFAHASSENLVDWGRQSYPTVKSGSNCLAPVVQYDAGKKLYTLYYTTTSGKIFATTTTDFKVYSPVVEAQQTTASTIAVTLPGGTEQGQVHRVSWSVVHHLTKTYQQEQFRREHH